jgi:endonuclease/exonuclease/phosphatase family metal-dependent hydrolase
MKGLLTTTLFAVGLISMGACSSTSANPAKSADVRANTPDSVGPDLALSEAIVPTDTADDEELSSDPEVGEFLLLTYNVAGLPKEFSEEQPEINNAKISPLLNDFDLVLVQEDFAYHEDLAAELTLPYQSEPFIVTETLPDGLNRFSVFSFPPVERSAWQICSGILDKANDCLAAKGFSVAPMEVSPGSTILVYNLHMDAGGDAEDQAARSAQVDQLLADIAARGVGEPIIVAGDTNLRMNRPADVISLDRLLNDGGLTDSCRFLDCDDEHIDRILFRSGDFLTITPASWSIPTNFVDEEGEDLSDHDPIAVRFAWRQ